MPTTIYDALIAESIREERKAQGVPMTELAEAVKVSYQQIQKYEKGINRVSASRLYMIADYLKTPVQDFLPPHSWE